MDPNHLGSSQHPRIQKSLRKAFSSVDVIEDSSTDDVFRDVANLLAVVMTTKVAATDYGLVDSHISTESESIDVHIIVKELQEANSELEDIEEDTEEEKPCGVKTTGRSMSFVRFELFVPL